MNYHYSHLEVSGQYAAAVLAVVLVLLLAVVYIRPPAAAGVVDDSYLRALASVVVPSTGSWQSQSTRVFTVYNKEIKIRLSSLVSGLHDGTIQFRDPMKLEEFICGKTTALGWTITLDVDFASNFITSKWLLSRAAPEPMYYPTLSSNPSLTLCLDLVPHSQLKASLSSFLDRVPPTGSVATIELITLDPTITQSFNNPRFIISSLPFLHRRTSTVFLLSLPRLLHDISKIRPNIVIDSVLNGSKAYDKNLNIYADRLVDDANGIISELGVETWRRQLIDAEWESGLLRAGYIHRWVIVLRRKK